jgi:serine/threonine protein kinase
MSDIHQKQQQHQSTQTGKSFFNMAARNDLSIPNDPSAFGSVADGAVLTLVGEGAQGSYNTCPGTVGGSPRTIGCKVPKAGAKAAMARERKLLALTQGGSQKSPFIVDYYSFVGTEQSVERIYMEHIPEATDFQTVKDNEWAGWTDVQKKIFLYEFALALKWVHGKNIGLLDCKNHENILLRRGLDGLLHVKIIDFGSAQERTAKRKMTSGYVMELGLKAYEGDLEELRNLCTIFGPTIVASVQDVPKEQLVDTVISGTQGACAQVTAPGGYNYLPSQ